MRKQPMSERKAPTCPYCGAEMVFMTYSVGDFYGCVKCGSRSPDFDINKNHLNYGVDMAYAAAMRRAEPVARVMTLDELKSNDYCDHPMWCEYNFHSPTLQPIIFQTARHDEMLWYVSFEGRDNMQPHIGYGKWFRYWYGCKPTDAQRAAAKWET